MESDTAPAAVVPSTPSDRPEPTPSSRSAVRPRRPRRSLWVVVAVAAALVVVLGAVYFVAIPPSPTEVSVTGLTIDSNYTNLPSGTPSPDVFRFGIAWGSDNHEFPSVTSFQGPAGGEVWLLVTIEDVVFSALGGPEYNCSVNDASIVPPFSTPSLEGQFAGGPLSSHPFPLNFSGQSDEYNPPAALTLNVTLPAHDGTYTPTIVFSISCEQYA